MTDGIGAPSTHSGRSYLSRYRLIGELARGGMGIVYVAAIQGPGGFSKTVVIKELKPEYAEDITFREMFLDEARIAARLSHANVVQTNEIAEEDGRYFIVMEYLEGQPYNRIVKKFKDHSTLSLGMKLRILSDALMGLHHAHELSDFEGKHLNVVHRDVSPQNIFVTYDGQTKVMDFGIAKALDSSHETRAGVLKGKVAYMAPEQVGGSSVDRRADIFSMGVVLWETLCHRRLWDGMNDVEILGKLLRGNIPRPSSVVHELPAGLEDVCMKALSPELTDRYNSAQEMAEALQPFISNEDSSTRKLSDVVSQAFARERKATKTKIDSALAGAGSNELEIPIIDVEQQSGGLLLSQSGRSSRVGPHSVKTGLPTSQTVIEKPVAANKSRALNIVLAIAAVVGVAFGLVAVFQHKGQPQAAASFSADVKTSAPVQQAVAVQPSAPAEPAQQVVHVEVLMAPAEARLFVDDVAVDGNPAKVSMPMDRKAHVLKIAADGFASKTTSVIFERDISLDVRLARAGGQGSVGNAAQPTSAAKVTEDPASSPAPSGKKSSKKIETSNPYGEN